MTFKLQLLEWLQMKGTSLHSLYNDYSLYSLAQVMAGVTFSRAFLIHVFMFTKAGLNDTPQKLNDQDRSILAELL